MARTNFGVLTGGALLLMSLLGISQAPAQNRSSAVGESLDLSATYGHMWGGHINTNRGTFRLATAGAWGLQLDIPVDEAAWVEVAYLRQDTQVNEDYRGAITKLTDMSVNYWQIGGVRGAYYGDVVPFISFSLGLTYYSPTESSVELGENTYTAESATQFSMILGGGLKTFFGDAKRVGIRAQFRILSTLYNTGAGFWIGSGGGTVSFGGSAVWQYEVSGGLVVRFGA